MHQKQPVFTDSNPDLLPEALSEGALPDYLGHRARLRKRFLAGDQGAMPDYELLEMLLGIIQPRKDTKGLAKRLLKIFSSFGGVIGAENGQLKAIEGMGESTIAMLKVIHEALCRILKQNLMNKPLMNTGERVIDYCIASMGYLGREQHRVLFLNNKNYLISDEMKSEGTVDHAHTYPREIIARALELRAKAIIMVHNHPGGDPTPSKQDLVITLHMKDIASRMEINLHDHIIVARGSHYSMRTQGDI